MKKHSKLFGAIIASALFGANLAHAEVSNVIIAFQNGWGYVPVMVMKEKGLFDKYAKLAGVTATADYKNLGTPAIIRDTILAGQTNYGVAGVPTLVQMNDKTNGDIKAIGNTVSLPMFLNTTDASAKTICDLDKQGTKIALPTVKSSVQAVTLQIAAKKLCGDALKLDKYTLSMTHPDGVAQLLTPGSEVTAHFTSPPFQYVELEDGKGRVRTLLNSYDALGGQTSFVLFIGSEKFAKENPKIHDIITKAYTEAMEFVSKNRVEAAKIYMAVEKPKEQEADVIKQMNDKLVSFDIAPNHIGTYAKFMAEIGSATKPIDWKAMSFPNLHGLNGS